MTQNHFDYEITDFEKGTYEQEQCLKSFFKMVDAYKKICKYHHFFEFEAEQLQAWMDILIEVEDIPDLK